MMVWKASILAERLLVHCGFQKWSTWRARVQVVEAALNLRQHVLDQALLQWHVAEWGFLLAAGFLPLNRLSNQLG